MAYITNFNQILSCACEEEALALLAQIIDKFDSICEDHCATKLYFSSEFKYVLLGGNNEDEKRRNKEKEAYDIIESGIEMINYIKHF